MDTNTRTILSFEDFLKQGGSQGQMGNEMPGFETEPVTDEIPTAGEEPAFTDEPTGDNLPVPAEEPTTDDSDAKVHMMDDETGEADAPTVDANIMMDNDPKKD